MELKNGSTVGGKRIATIDDLILLEERIFAGGGGGSGSGGGSGGEDLGSLYKVEIISDRGNVFRNGVIDTWLECRVYRGSRDVTDLVINDLNYIFSWERNSNNPPADEVWKNNRLSSYRQHITKADVPTNPCVFKCSLVDKTTSTIILSTN